MGGMGGSMKLFSMLKILLLTYVFTGLLLLLLSLGLYKLGLSQGQVRIGILAIYVLSGFFGGFFMGKAGKNRRFLWGVAMGAVYFLVLTLISLAANRGLSAGALQLLGELGLCMAGGMLGGMLS